MPYSDVKYRTKNGGRRTLFEKKSTDWYEFFALVPTFTVIGFEKSEFKTVLQKKVAWKYFPTTFQMWHVKILLGPMLKIHFFQKYTYIKYLTILKSFNFDQSYVNDNTDKFKKDSDNFKNSFLYVPLLLSLENFISYLIPIIFFHTCNW